MIESKAYSRDILVRGRVRVQVSAAQHRVFEQRLPVTCPEAPRPIRSSGSGCPACCPPVHYVIMRRHACTLIRSAFQLQILKEDGTPCKPGITTRRELFRALGKAVTENLAKEKAMAPPPAAAQKKAQAKAAASAKGGGGGSSKKKKKKK